MDRKSGKLPLAVCSLQLPMYTIHCNELKVFSDRTVDARARCVFAAAKAVLMNP